MRKLILTAAIGLFSLITNAQNYGTYNQVYVNPYQTSSGTYVSGHYRTAPNNTRNDNWSTVGNVNPYTGQHGTKPRDNYYNNNIPSSYNYNNYNSRPKNNYYKY